MAVPGHDTPQTAAQTTDHGPAHDPALTRGLVSIAAERWLREHPADAEAMAQPLASIYDMPGMGSWLSFCEGEIRAARGRA